MEQYRPFSEGKPVWAPGLKNAANCHVGFVKVISGEKRKVQIRLATAGFYRMFLNGEFICYGPARAAKGRFRVDVVEITLSEGENHLAIQAVNHGIRSFGLMSQDAFLQVEVVEGEKVLAATGVTGKDFSAYVLTERVQRVQRYSYQRPFAEGYRLQPGYDGWRIGRPTANAVPCEPEEQPEKVLLPRNLHPPVFPETTVSALIAEGRFRIAPPKDVRKDRSLLYACAHPEDTYLEGWSEEELEWHLSDDAQCFLTSELTPKNTAAPESILLCGGEFRIVELPGERSGLLALDIECHKAGTLYLLFDELKQENGDVSTTRLGCCNVIRLDCAQGCYHFLTEECYALKYWKLLAAQGNFTVSRMRIVEHICPEPITRRYRSADERINAILLSAKQTFLQNSTDIFTDCPSRERAGWLCDSFFLGRSEFEFTGQNAVERNFLENYALPDRFDDIPDGMVPMCYPSDQTPEGYIPNWAMWLLIELADYCGRTGDRSMAERFTRRVDGLLNWFSRYENGDGLLEKLPGWIFVEWSKSNEFVQDINYPTNMLYGLMLCRLGALYRSPEWEQKGERILQTVRERSFDGTFFVDNAVYNEEQVAVNTGERTETCQYYAFFTGAATPQTYPRLWKILTEEFGADRQARGLYPEIYPSNAFIGNFLRMLLLTEHGYYRQMLAESVSYYYYMAQRTGTLWEHAGDYASCNHGFASYIAHLIRVSEEHTAR